MRPPRLASRPLPCASCEKFSARSGYDLDPEFSEMKIIDKLHRENPAFSFELLPPKDEAGVDQLFTTVSELKPYAPT